VCGLAIAAAGMGEEEVLGDIVTFKAMEEGEEDRVLNIRERVGILKLCILGCSDSINGRMWCKPILYNFQAAKEVSRIG